MNAGAVHDRRALFPVTFRLAGRPDLTIEFQVDTGFTDYLLLPAQAVALMGLSYLNRKQASLPDDSTVKMDIYRATIIWDQRPLNVPVVAAGRRPLLGAALLDGHELRVRYAEGDRVTVQDL